MSIKRYSGTGFTDVSSRKRWNGSAWVDLTIGKRWNGSAWVDLWSASSGSSGSSGGNTGNDAREPETTKTGKGTFKNGSSTTFTSTASNPPVNYSAAYTYTATASVTQHVGCKVVMVDSQKDSIEMDYEKLEAAINDRTKAIVAVDLGGMQQLEDFG